MLLTVHMPNEPFNTLVRTKQAGPLIKRIMDHVKPEAAYFSEMHGQRAGILVVNVNDPSEIPALCEPFFLHFDAECELRTVMLPEDLAKADLDGIADKWA